MRLSVDRQRCEGHGLCEGIEAALFRLDDQAELQLPYGDRAIPPEFERRAEEAVRTCPMGALRLEP